MNLYRVTADKCGYDQYDEFIVWASSPAEAEEVINAKARADEWWGKGQKWTAEPIDQPSESGIVLGSFNAG
jgi:hypothetical protein